MVDFKKLREKMHDLCAKCGHERHFHHDWGLPPWCSGDPEKSHHCVFEAKR